jgi:hypothetical protein
MSRPRLLLATALALACDPRPAVPPDQPAASSASSAATPPDATPTAPPPAAADAGEPTLATPAFAAGPFEVRVGKGKPIAPTKAFPQAHVGPDMQDHAWAFGWTADSGAFAHCTIVSGEDCKHCTYTRPDGAREQLRSGKQCTEKGVTMVTKKDLKQRLVDRGVAVRDGEWAHGGAVLVTTREVMGAPDSDGEARAILKVGAARRDGSGEADAYEEAACTRDKGQTSCFTVAHAEAILLSPDGATVAILGHMWEGEYSDTFSLGFIPAGRLAAAAYNQQGLAALARNDLPAAADAFLAAMHADPTAWKGPYNLACAHARAADPRARPALQAALDRAPDPVRKRAATDKDLDSVRTQPWFTAMLTPPG